MSQIHERAPRSRSLRYLRLIAAFKFLQALVLLAAAIGLLQLLHKDVDEVVEGWVSMLRCDPENQFIAAVLAKLNLLDDHKLKALSGLTFLFAGLFLTESTGLFFGKRWAEFLTAIATGSFIPIELYELWRHPTAAKVTLVVLNVAVVLFLIRLLRPEGHSSAERFAEVDLNGDSDAQRRLHPDASSLGKKSCDHPDPDFRIRPAATEQARAEEPR